MANKNNSVISDLLSGYKSQGRSSMDSKRENASKSLPEAGSSEKAISNAKPTRDSTKGVHAARDSGVAQEVAPSRSNANSPNSQAVVEPVSLDSLPERKDSSMVSAFISTVGTTLLPESRELNNANLSQATLPSSQVLESNAEISEKNDVAAASKPSQENTISVEAPSPENQKSDESAISKEIPSELGEDSGSMISSLANEIATFAATALISDKGIRVEQLAEEQHNKNESGFASIYDVQYSQTSEAIPGENGRSEVLTSNEQNTKSDSQESPLLDDPESRTVAPLTNNKDHVAEAIAGEQDVKSDSRMAPVFNSLESLAVAALTDSKDHVAEAVAVAEEQAVKSDSLMAPVFNTLESLTVAALTDSKGHQVEQTEEQALNADSNLSPIISNMESLTFDVLIDSKEANLGEQLQGVAVQDTSRAAVTESISDSFNIESKDLSDLQPTTEVRTTPRSEYSPETVSRVDGLTSANKDSERSQVDAQAYSNVLPSLEQHIEKHELSSPENLTDMASGLANLALTRISELKEKGQDLSAEALDLSSGGTQPMHTTGVHGVSLQTLDKVASSGLSEGGLQELKSGLGAEGSALSNLQLADRVGVEAISQMEEKGFPNNEVSAIQDLTRSLGEAVGAQHFEVSKLEGLELLKEVTSPDNSSLLMYAEMNSQKAVDIGFMGKADFSKNSEIAGTSVEEINASLQSLIREHSAQTAQQENTRNNDHEIERTMTMPQSAE